MQKIILDTIEEFRKKFNVVRYEQDGLQLAIKYTD